MKIVFFLDIIARAWKSIDFARYAPNVRIMFKKELRCTPKDVLKNASK